MKSRLEKLWNEYLAEECAVIDTDEERRITKIAAELHEKVNAMLNDEQKIAVEKFVDALCDAEAAFTKKAFFKGCEFATPFFLESGDLGK